MIDIVYQIFNELDQSVAGTQSKAALQKNLDTQSSLKELEVKHEQLKLITLGLWEMLKSHNGLSDDDLKGFVNKVDMLDGKIDGKAGNRKQTYRCSKCTHNVLSTSTRCMYCGERNQKYSPLSGL